jgi:hypothetical protein
MQRTPGELFLDRLRPALVPAVVVLGLLLLVVRARRELQAAPRFQVDPSACEVLVRPEWVSEELAAALARQIGRGLGREASLLGEQELQAWEQTLTGLTPWIEEVEGVEPRFPYQADVRLRLRRPVLVVDGVFLVAATGDVLGPGPVSITPPPLGFDGGQRDEDFRECAAAAAELLPFRRELEDLDVQVVSVGIAEDDTVVFRTEQGVELNWGRTARKSHLSQLDLPPEARIGNLRQVLVDYPGLRGVRAVLLWTDLPVVTERRG